MKYLAIILIRIYQIFLSPLKISSCRFRPTCSVYSITAIKRFGLFYGGYLSIRRICKCHPWGGCGYDPVPEREEK